MHTVADRLQRTREVAVPQFTASSELIVFPTPLAADQVALLVIDRRTDRRRLIASEATFFTFPRLSADGERLLFAQTKGGVSRLLSCGVKDWKCWVAAETGNSITHPTELDPDRILYVSSPLVTRLDGAKRFDKHDFYLSERSRGAIRLTDFELFELGPLDVCDRKLMFSATGPSKLKPIIPGMQPLAHSKSDIFVVNFDPENPRIPTPEHTLEPQYVIDGSYSIAQTVSPDGTKVAIIYTRTGISPYRYDLVIVTVDGTVLKRVDASTFQFSRAAFAGPTTVLANQVFEDRYEVTEVDLTNGSVRKAATAQHSHNMMGNLEHIQITGISH